MIGHTNGDPLVCWSENGERDTTGVTPKIFFGFSTSDSAVVALAWRMIDSGPFLSTTKAGSFSSTDCVSLIDVTASPAGLSSWGGIELVNNKGLSVISVVGVRAAAVSAPGDGVRGGSLTLGFLECWTRSHIYLYHERNHIRAHNEGPILS